jgi:rhamnosyltransferase
MKIVAVVIWFHPDVIMVENIRSYSKHVLKTIIVDNSPEDNSVLIESENNIEYISLKKNFGIATALNIGYKRAEELGSNWILTMDQDSLFLDSDIKNYLNPNANHFKEPNVSVFGPNFEGPPTNDLIDCNSVISSGSLVNLEAHIKNFGYNEDLFIDQVDHEYCFRLKKLGCRIIRVGYLRMTHTVGSPLTKKRFGRVFISHNHNATRRYYITRNTLYMRHHFCEFGDKYFKLLFMDLINVIFIENNKYNKLKMMFKGCLDYLTGRMGSID